MSLEHSENLNINDMSIVFYWKFRFTVCIHVIVFIPFEVMGVDTYILRLSDC